IDDVVNNFVAPSPELCEFSVEAGRPDSITAGKLASMLSAGVTRISVNPQTMNDETLRLIGRRHTADDMLRAFAMARDAGFDNINTDIICGLPGEDEAAFSRTLDVICALSPESVTVHTLSVKRAADLKRDALRSTLQADITGSMVSSAYSRLCGLGFRPYYMYRQKNMVGNHENVAYCRSGFESPYNIHIMEEDQTILACGAGSVSKRVTPGVIRRAFNVKSVEEYLARSGEMTERKRELFILK
ncbi:MAG: radical SAM protein, partial [Clostridia bacterium]|nr:radical SAM protein [Clostridia bacterium]